MPTDTMCAGGPDFSSATITGQLGGVPIERTYDNCTSVGLRWISDLTVAGVLAPE